ncbi:MAG: hypothetical protein JW754_05125 [Candidatus Aenigmarchaeota archaeon]|nr:hypothetical protein [Candidatus Aenigmarchaeota archaeon]
MVSIISEKGYPHDGKILTLLNYYERYISVREGGVLIVGKDSQGKEFKPKNKPYVRSYYTLPSGSSYSVPVGSEPKKNHPAIHFPFQLEYNLSTEEILEENKTEAESNNFMRKFNLTLMDESFHGIELNAQNEEWFKYLTIWGAFELAQDVVSGRVSNHFWGEMYHELTPELEEFLKDHRK